MEAIKFVISFLILMLCGSTSTWAAGKTSKGDVNPSDQFQIDFVNTPNGKIVIGEKDLEKGGIFLASQTIRWQNKKNWIEISNTRTGYRYKVSGYSYDEVGENSLNNFIRKRYTASKGFDDALRSTGEFLSRYTWDIIDGELRIPINLQLDDSHGIILNAIPSNIEIVADYDDETNEIIITSEILSSRGIEPSKVGQYVFHVEYVHNGIRNALTDEFRMRYID